MPPTILTTNILITGANRGLGLALLKTYLLRPSYTIIAAVRSTTHSTTLALSQLPKHTSSTLVVVKIDSAVESDPKEAVKALEGEYSIEKLDVVIANAGICDNLYTVTNATAEDLHQHVQINVVAPVLLFQAALPLLEKAANPKFVTMSSSAGSIGGMDIRQVPNMAYGPSKAMLNFVTRKVHFEHPGVVAFSIDPGWVQTDMGNAGAKAYGLEQAEITVNESVGGMVVVIDAATREKYSGRFPTYTGELSQW